MADAATVKLDIRSIRLQRFFGNFLLMPLMIGSAALSLVGMEFVSNVSYFVNVLFVGWAMLGAGRALPIKKESPEFARAVESGKIQAAHGIKTGPLRRAWVYFQTAAYAATLAGLGWWWLASAAALSWLIVYSHFAMVREAVYADAAGGSDG